jgi:uncharacterized protein
VTQPDAHHFVQARVLRINVGFLLAQGVGYYRVTEIDLPRVRLAEDVTLDFLRGALRLSRNSHGILVQGDLETHVLTECVRCLTPFYLPVPLHIEELFSIPPYIDTPYTVDEAGNLDLAPLLREEAILALPTSALCRPDCAGLCPECGQNLNEGHCHCHSENIDPRFAILAQLHLDERPEE